MSARQDQLLKANWDRMREALTRAAREHRRTAEALEQISFDVVREGVTLRRSPDAVIAEVARVTHTSANADLVHRLGTWAESINDLLINPLDRTPEGAISSRVLCPAALKDPDAPERCCVLSAGHSLPTDDGLTVHVDEDGVLFS